MASATPPFWRFFESSLKSANAMPAVSPLAVGAGALNLAGLDVTVASLEVTSDSAALDFGAGAEANHFVATSGAVGAWSGRLTIGHFDPATDTLRLGTSDSDAHGNADRITFVDPGMSVGSYAAVVQPDGYVTVGELIVTNPDADGDGMADAWAIAHFGSTAALPGDDVDRDGFTNLQERWAGTDPTSRGSRPCIASIRSQSDDMIIRFDSVLGRKYCIQSSDDLKNGPEPFRTMYRGPVGRSRSPIPAAETPYVASIEWSSHWSERCAGRTGTVSSPASRCNCWMPATGCPIPLDTWSPRPY